jgi:nicotinate-nucleotide adenylyltransferase
MIEISATEIRQRLAAGLSVDYLTPEPVVDYIREHQLYRPAKTG